MHVMMNYDVSLSLSLSLSLSFFVSGGGGEVDSQMLEQAVPDAAELDAVREKERKKSNEGKKERKKDRREEGEDVLTSLHLPSALCLYCLLPRLVHHMIDHFF